MNTMWRNYILGLLCLMISGPCVLLAVFSGTVAKYPEGQLLLIGTGLLSGAAGALLIIWGDSENA